MVQYLKPLGTQSYRTFNNDGMLAVTQEQLIRELVTGYSEVCDAYKQLKYLPAAQRGTGVERRLAETITEKVRELNDVMPNRWIRAISLELTTMQTAAQEVLEASENQLLLFGGYIEGGLLQELYYLERSP